MSIKSITSHMNIKERIFHCNILPRQVDLAYMKSVLTYGSDLKLDTCPLPNRFRGMPHLRRPENQLIRYRSKIRYAAMGRQPVIASLQVDR